MKRILVVLALVLYGLPSVLTAQEAVKLTENVFRGWVHVVKDTLPMDTSSVSAKAREDIVRREICNVGLDFKDQRLLGRVGVWKDSLCGSLLTQLAQEPLRLRTFLAGIEERYKEEVKKPSAFTPEPGPRGLPGTPGTPGTNGISCWDLNTNGAADSSEDSNGDGRVDVVDCRGKDGLTPSIPAPQFVPSKFPLKPVIIGLVATAAAGTILCVTEVICPDEETRLKNTNINIYGDMLVSRRSQGGFYVGTSITRW